MPSDLRTFLSSWGQEHPEEVLSIDKEVSVKWETTFLQAALDRKGRHPTLIFRKPRNHHGELTPHPLITNIFASRRRIASVLGFGPREVAAKYTARVANKRAPVVVDRKSAPVKECIWKGEEVNLHRFPVVWHHETDPGPYITAGVVTTVDPDSGIHNSALQRCWIKTKNKTGVWPNSASHNFRNIQKYWARDQDAPVAVWIGHHPAALLGAQVKAGYPEDHYHSMGGLLGEPLRLVPSEMFGEKLLVPADAEVVIEGTIPRNHWEAEGPFGEFPRYSGPQLPNPVINVSCITSRGDAYWHDLCIGHLDSTIPGVFPTEAAIYEAVKRITPDVLNVRRAPYGLNIYIQIRKTRPGIAKDVILAALPVYPSVCKYIFVFDEDIDIFDDNQILWALGTRTQLDHDLIVVPGGTASPLDPSIPEYGVGTKAGFDCTKPAPPEPGLPARFSPTLSIPDVIGQRLRLEDYVGTGELNQIQAEEVYW